MRPLALALALLLLLPAARAQEDVRDPAKVSAMLDFDGCQVAPGTSCAFEIHLKNSYAGAMRAVNFTAEVFEYATIEERRTVDASWPYAYPGLNTTNTRKLDLALGDVPAGYVGPFNFTILTSWDMPYGSWLSQGSYYLRFRLEFDFTEGNATRRYTLASWGHFTQAQRLAATGQNPATCPPTDCRGDVNLTTLWVDGLLPDSSFGVREPIPLWPYYLLIAGTVAFLVLAFFFYAEENPGTFPRTERAWALIRGKLRVLRPSRRRL